MLMLPKLWKHLEAEHRLTSDCFVVLSFFLCDRPGRVVYQGRRYGADDPRKVRARPGLAEELGWDRLRVHRAIKLLRECGLLRVETFRRREALSKLNLSTICRYDVAIEMLERGALDDHPAVHQIDHPVISPDPRSLLPLPLPALHDAPAERMPFRGIVWNTRSRVAVMPRRAPRRARTAPRSRRAARGVGKSKPRARPWPPSWLRGMRSACPRWAAR